MFTSLFSVSEPKEPDQNGFGPALAPSKNSKPQNYGDATSFAEVISEWSSDRAIGAPIPPSDDTALLKSERMQAVVSMSSDLRSDTSAACEEMPLPSVRRASNSNAAQVRSAVISVEGKVRSVRWDGSETLDSGFNSKAVIASEVRAEEIASAKETPLLNPFARDSATPSAGAIRDGISAPGDLSARMLPTAEKPRTSNEQTDITLQPRGSNVPLRVEPTEDRVHRSKGVAPKGDAPDDVRRPMRRTGVVEQTGMRSDLPKSVPASGDKAHSLPQADVLDARGDQVALGRDRSQASASIRRIDLAEPSGPKGYETQPAPLPQSVDRSRLLTGRTEKNIAVRVDSAEVEMQTSVRAKQRPTDIQHLEPGRVANSGTQVSQTSHSSKRADTSAQEVGFKMAARTTHSLEKGGEQQSIIEGRDDVRSKTSGPVTILESRPRGLMRVYGPTPVTHEFASERIGLAITFETVPDGDGAPLGAARNTDDFALGPQATGTVNASFPVRAANFLAAEIAASAPGEIEVALSPKELGSLKFRMSLAETGLIVHISADRPETADLVRRNMNLLSDALAGEGFENVAFSFDDRPRMHQGDSDLPPELSPEESDKFGSGDTVPPRPIMRALDMRL